jgi:fatty acid desaturase
MSAAKRWMARGGCTYVCLACWFFYYLLIPTAFAHSAWIGLVFACSIAPFIGVWAIYLMHECWHRYFEGIDNRKMFLAFCALLFTQPGAYGHGHRSHHRHVNTYEDLEIHPAGRIASRGDRIFFYIGSSLFGSLFLLFFGLGQTDTDDSNDSRWNRLMPLAWLGAWGTIAIAAWAITQAPWTDILLAYLASIWATSFAHRHNEMIEHGAIIAEGSLRFRASQTRNLNPDSLLARCFLLITHDDSREHTLHHTQPDRNWRLEAASPHKILNQRPSISLGDYFQLTLRLMAGHEPAVTKESATNGGKNGAE